MIDQPTVRLSAATALLLLTSACATTELSPQAQAVSFLPESRAGTCTFLETISANNQNTLVKDPELDARNRAKNQAAELGGNRLVLKTSNLTPSSSGIGGVFALTADVYQCP